MSKPRNRTYKRTWRNLLLNKRYQLRFTLFMVGLSSILMGLLGWWVMSVAASATTLAVNNTLTACQDLPRTSGGEDPGDLPGDDAPRSRPVVTIDDSGMGPSSAAPAAPPVRAAPPRSAMTFEQCKAAMPAKVKKLEDRQQLIFYVLIAAGLVLAIGLLIYGIKMTHRVAGPLHKVTLYMAKLSGGVYDPVYALRKGDHLLEFYEHFKAAHSGMRALQEQDVARLRALVAAADDAQLAARSPELADTLGELRDMLERKEKSLV